MDEAAPYRQEMNKFIEDNVIIGGNGEDIILKNGLPAPCLYGDRTHMYVCRLLDWVRNRHRYVRRFEVNGTPSDKTVKDLICLFSDLSLLQHGLQLGRANAVLRRIHRMTTLGLSIDDHDERLGADDDLTLEKVADEGVRMEEVDCGLHVEFIELSALLSTVRVLLVAVWRSSDHGW